MRILELEKLRKGLKSLEGRARKKLMAYYTQEQLKQLGFKSIGINVQISDKASIYNCNQIEVGNNSRIDDFCVISGKIKIGDNVHITPMCLIAGGEKGIVFEDFVTIAYGVKYFHANKKR